MINSVRLRRYSVPSSASWVTGMRQVEVGLLSHGLQKPPRTRGMKSGESKVVVGTKELTRDLRGSQLLVEHPIGTKLLWKQPASKGKVE